MLEKAKYLKIPFQEYQPWVEKQLNEQYLSTHYENSRKNNIPRMSSQNSSSSSDYSLNPTLKRRNTDSDKDELRRFISSKKKQEDGYMELKDDTNQESKDK